MIGAELTSHPEGMFNYDDSEKIGEWVWSKFEHGQT